MLYKINISSISKGMKLYLESIVEVSEIAADAAKECFYDGRHWLANKVGGLIARIDEWACDYGNEDV